MSNDAKGAGGAMTTRSVECGICRKTYHVTAPAEQFAVWESGVLAQRAFPGMSEDDRELLISQTCGKCFDALFDGMDDEEYSELEAQDAN